MRWNSATSLEGGTGSSRRPPRPYTTHGQIGSLFHTYGVEIPDIRVDFSVAANSYDWYVPRPHRSLMFHSDRPRYPVVSIRMNRRFLKEMGLPSVPVLYIEAVAISLPGRIFGAQFRSTSINFVELLWPHPYEGIFASWTLWTVWPGPKFEEVTIYPSPCSSCFGKPTKYTIFLFSSSHLLR